MSEMLPEVRVKTLYLKTARPEPARYRRAPEVPGHERDLRIQTLFLPPMPKSKSQSRVYTMTLPTRMTPKENDFAVQGRNTTRVPSKPQLLIKSTFRKPEQLQSLMTVKPVRKQKPRKRDKPVTPEPGVVFVFELQHDEPPEEEERLRASLTSRPASPLELPPEKPVKVQRKDWTFIQENP